MEKEKKKGMNLPNKLTVLRICLVPVFIVVMIVTFSNESSLDFSLYPSISYATPGKMTLSMNPLVIAGSVIHHMGKIITRCSAHSNFFL